MGKCEALLVWIFIFLSHRSVSNGTKMEIIEDEVVRDEDWIIVLRCNIHTASDNSEKCSSIAWTHETEDSIIEAVHNDTDLYTIQNDLDNLTSILQLVSSDVSEDLYTCIVNCDTRSYRINCWLGEQQYKERSSVCSQRRFNEIISATAIVPPVDESEQKKSKDLKIGVSIICMIVVGMALTVIIRCRLKRQDALKHARVVIENANQCLLETQNRVCNYPYPERRSPSTSDNSPIYRPVSQNTVSQSRPHRNLERLHHQTQSRSYPNRLVLQEMADGSQLIFIPGSNLPTYEASQNTTRRLSTFIDPPQQNGSIAQNPFGFLTANKNSEDIGHLSSPPSYSSMAGSVQDPEQSNVNDQQHPSESLDNASCDEGLFMNRQCDLSSDPSTNLINHNIQEPNASCSSISETNCPPPVYQVLDINQVDRDDSVITGKDAPFESSTN